MKMYHINGEGDYDLTVVGVQYYQPALVRLLGKERRLEGEAVLHLETSNPHDPNAIRVEIEKQVVGYIPRDEAKAVRDGLAAYGVRGGQQVSADIAVGRKHDGTVGAWLDVPLEYD